MSERAFEEVGRDEIWQGRIVDIRVGKFRHADGEVVEREVIGHPGAVAIVVHDETHVYLVRQPREATGEFDLLEIPAGKTDVEGEAPEATARRELAEEIGKEASEWEHMTYFYPSPGILAERCDLYRATGLSDVEVECEEDERIEIVRWPLSDLAGAIAECHDAKSLIGLTLLERALDGSTAVERPA